MREKVLLVIGMVLCAASAALAGATAMGMLITEYYEPIVFVCLGVSVLLTVGFGHIALVNHRLALENEEEEE